MTYICTASSTVDPSEFQPQKTVRAQTYHDIEVWKDDIGYNNNMNGTTSQRALRNDCQQVSAHLPLLYEDEGVQGEAKGPFFPSFSFAMNILSP